jgi:hypothetical protein
MSLPDPKELFHPNREKKAALDEHFESIWVMRELAAENHALPFLFLWQMLELVAEEICGEYQSPYWLDALKENDDLSGRHASVLANPKSLMRMYNLRFAQTWPVFDICKADPKLFVQNPIREETISAYLASGMGDFQPACWIRHRAEGTIPQPDWQHSLSAWQMVRRNLAIRGERLSELDTRIVSNAFLSLLYFFKEGQVFQIQHNLTPNLFERTEIFASPMLGEDYGEPKK